MDYIFEPKIFKTQKSVLGYNYKGIKKLFEERKIHFPEFSKTIFIHNPFTCGLRVFGFIKETEDAIIIQSGLVQYRIQR